VLAAMLAAIVGGSVARAEDISKKWRFGFALGGYDSDDKIVSASANRMFTLNPCSETMSCPAGADTILRAFEDPRNDSSAFGALDVRPGYMGTLSAQYGISKIFVIEGSVGYQKGDVGDVEVAVQLFGDGSDDPNIDYNFTTQRVPVGEIERVPIQLTGLLRFRPRAAFNPYFGAGVGYAVLRRRRSRGKLRGLGRHAAGRPGGRPGQRQRHLPVAPRRRRGADRQEALVAVRRSALDRRLAVVLGRVQQQRRAGQLAAELPAIR
jgi:hypothetical protein